MRILMVTPCIPTETDGRRPYNFLKYLSKDHTVYVLGLRHPCQREEQSTVLREWGIQIQTCPIHVPVSVLQCVPGMLKRDPMRVSWCRNRALRIAIGQFLATHTVDIVHFDRMRMGQYADLAPGIPKLVDFTDSLVMYLERSIVYRRKWRERLIDLWERKTIPDFERKVLNQVECGLVCSEVDAQIFRRYHPDFEFVVIENSVDLQDFRPQKRDGDESPQCVITGTLFYFPNIDSVIYWKDEILPCVRNLVPELRTRIIGTRPVPRVRDLEGVQNITLAANVPTMAQELFTNDIYVCPLRVGAGVRNKILEAMAAGMAIVSTSLGIEGMKVEDGREVIIADTPGKFAEAIRRLVESPALRKTLGENARHYVETYHDGNRLGEQLVRLYERLIERGCSA